jgi:undecaprenyl diphosphate synthase
MKNGGGVPEILPRHIGIIMDGNGRWAKKRGMPRVMGHRRGVRTARETVITARELGIEALTLYAFSRENWKRPASEVGTLMELLHEYLKNELTEMVKNNIRLQTIGEISMLPAKVQDILEEVMETTSENTGMILTLALSYGGRHELVKAFRKMAEECLAGKLDTENINEQLVSAYLDTSDLPDPDFIIRTSGEFRLSNFLLYQSAYAELYVTSTLWPDFNREEFLKALRSFESRERRFGLTGDQINRQICTASES